ncbi:MAG TPA: response regulator [Candidatus Sulfotelmatobacter sp.]|nr:response regulator [Candidatus Sulfotelmatobacter sp.]
MPTILVVDDDADVLSISAVIVEELGYRVIEANGGAQALEILRSPEPVDLLLTDLAMPDVSGQELAHIAKGLRPALKVLYTSAYVRLSDKDPALRYGPMIEKPWLHERLRTVLEQLMGPRRPHAR